MSIFLFISFITNVHVEIREHVVKNQKPKLSGMFPKQKIITFFYGDYAYFSENN